MAVVLTEDDFKDTVLQDTPKEPEQETIQQTADSAVNKFNLVAEDFIEEQDKSKVVPTPKTEEDKSFLEHMKKFDREASYAFDKASTDVENFSIYLTSKYPMGGWTNKLSLPGTKDDSFLKDADTLYGAGFTEADEETRRKMLLLNKKQNLAREYPDIAPEEERGDIASGFGTFTGTLASPSTLIPAGKTLPVASAIGAGLGFTYGVSEGLASESGKVDPETTAMYTATGAVLPPAFAVLWKGTGAAYTKVAEKLGAKKASKEANELIDSYEESIYYYIAAGKSPAEATKLTNTLLDVDTTVMREASTSAERKVHIPTQKQAQNYLEGVAAAEGSAVHKGGVWEDYLGVISTAVKDISVPIWHRFRKLEYNQHVNVHNFNTRINPFLTQLKRLSSEDKDVVTLALFNSDFKTVETIFKKGGYDDLLTSFKTVEEVLGELHTLSKDAGIKVGYVENYFPRRVKDYNTFLESQGKEAISALNKAIKKAEEAKGKKLTPTEKIEFSDKYLRGRVNVEGTPSFARERSVDNLTMDMLKLYQSPEQAIHSYVHRAVNEIEKRKFFGRHAKTSEFGHIDTEESVGALLQAEEKLGRLNPLNTDRLKTLLDSRFGPGEQSPASFVQKTKNILYLTTIANPISAMTQLGDIFLTTYKNGFVPVIKTLATKNKVKLDDYGFTDIAEEFADKDKTAKWLNSAFKWTGFSGVDRIGKEVLLNSSLKKYTNEISDPKKLQKFIKKWRVAFGDDTDALVNDLRKGDTKSDHVRLLLWHDLSDMQPVSLAEVPKKYLDAPNGRGFYMLKTFTIKALDNMRRDGIKLLKKKGSRTEGAKNLAKYMAVFTASGMSTDAVKSWALGREYDIEDSAVESLWKLIGMNKYASESFADKPFQEASKIVLPPLNIFDGMIEDAWNALDVMDEGLEAKGTSIRNLPGFGRLYYEYFLGGGERYKERKDKERRGFRRGGLVSQASRLGFSKGGEAYQQETSMSLGQQQRLIDESNKPNTLLPITEGTVEEEPSMLDEMSSAYTKRLTSMDESRKDREKGEIGLTRSTVNTAGAMAGLAFDAAGIVIEESVDTYLDNLKSFAPTTYKDTAEKVTEAKDWALNTEAGQLAVEAAQKGYEEYSAWKKANPQDAKTFEAVVNIGMFGWGAKGVASQMNKLTSKKDKVLEGEVLPPSVPSVDKNPKSFFTEDAITNADKDRLVYLEPSEFLALAEKINTKGKFPEILEAKKSKAFERAQQGTPFTTLPFLDVSSDSKGLAKVTGHNGRNRALALQELGVPLMPVVLKGDFDKADNFPTELRNQDDTTTVPFPIEPKRDKKAEDKELITLAEGLTESGGFKYKLPTMLLDLTLKEKIAPSKPSQWKYNIARWAKKGKIKKEELDDSRIMGWLDTLDKDTKVPTKDIFNFMQDNSPMLKTYTSKVASKRDDDWYNEQPLIKERAQLVGDYHNKLGEVAYLQDLDNIGDVSSVNKGIVKETADWLHHVSIEDIVNNQYNVYDIDTRFLKFFRDSAYLPKALKTAGIVAKFEKNTDSILHPDNQQLDIPEYLDDAAEALLAQASPEKRNSIIGNSITHDLSQAALKAEGNEKVLLDNYLDIFVSGFKSKTKKMKFETDNRAALRKVGDEAMRRNEGDVLPGAWGEFALPNTRGKPVTILVQSKVGKEDRLKKFKDFGERVSRETREGIGTGRPIGQYNSIPELERIIGIMRGRPAYTKERLENERELRQRKAEFKKDTGVDWEKREEYYSNLEGNLYAEPHFTGVHGESPLKQGVPQENIIMHIRGNVIEQESLGKGKGLFIGEQQSQAHQTAMGNKRHFENLAEIAPEFRGISGYSQIDTGNRVAELMKKRDKLQKAVDKLWQDNETDSGWAKPKSAISKIVTPMDAEISAIEVEIRKLTGQTDVNRLRAALGESLPENLSHKKDWTPLAMKQSIKYAIDNDLNYIALPIEKHTINVIEQWGDREPGVMKAIIDRNSIYSPRAYRNIVKKWDKDAKPFESEYLDREADGGWFESDIHKVIVLPITDAIKAGYKKDGLTAYRRGGLVTQMKALSLNE